MSENGKPSAASSFFSAAAQWSCRQSGRAYTFVLAVVVVVAWAALGPLFRFSDTWQLVINTGTTIVTFLMVFLIQNTQNRDTAALHLKMDELIRVNKDARNKLLSLEDLTEEELQHVKKSFDRIAERGQPGVGELPEAEKDLDEAEEKVEQAEAGIARARATVSGQPGRNE